MVRRVRPTIGALTVSFGGLLVTACSWIGDSSSSCDRSEGLETLEGAGLGTEGLTVLEGCTDVTRGLRSGEVREVVATGDEASVDRALELGGVDAAQATFDGVARRDAPPMFDVAETPVNRRHDEWREGERLDLHDRVEYRDRDWDRYVSWGQDEDSDDYLIFVTLETGSL